MVYTGKEAEVTREGEKRLGCGAGGDFTGAGGGWGAVIVTVGGMKAHQHYREEQKEENIGIRVP